MIRMRKRLEGERKFELCFPNTLLLRPPMWMRRAKWIDRKTVANSADCFPASWVVIDWTLHSSLRSPNLFFLCCDKHHYQKQLGKQSLFSLYIPGHGLSLIEVRAGTQIGTWRQELKQRSPLTGCVSASRSVSYLSCTHWHHLPRVGTHLHCAGTSYINH